MTKKNKIASYQPAFFRRELAIDLGTSSTLIFSPRRGVLLQEPSVIAIDKRSGAILAAGNKAAAMMGKTPGNIEAIKPLREGVVADYYYAQKMLQFFFHKVKMRFPLMKVRAIITVPYGTTQVERQAVITAGKRVGIKEIYLIEEPLAAAIGSGLPIDEAQGTFVVNMGGGVTEIAAVALGGIVKARSLRQGGDALDVAIQRHVYQHHKLEIGPGTAEKAKFALGYAISPRPEEIMELRGINWQTQRPGRAVINAQELTEAMTPVLYPITIAIKNVFEQIHPQFASDVLNRGVFLVGGGSLLRNMEVFLAGELDLEVKIVDNPISCTVKGASQALRYLGQLEYLELYRA